MSKLMHEIEVSVLQVFDYGSTHGERLVILKCSDAIIFDRGAIFETVDGFQLKILSIPFQDYPRVKNKICRCLMEDKGNVLKDGLMLTIIDTGTVDDKV